MKVLEPTIETTGAFTLARRPTTLDGKTIGIIWNGRAPGDKILRMVIDGLRGKYRIKEVVWAKPKPFTGNVAPPEILDEIAGKADVALTGVGD